MGNPANEIGFQIQRATGAAGAFATIANGLANTTSYVDTQVTIGTTYRYQIIAYNAAGNSTSNAVTVTANLPAPTGLTATMSPTTPLAITMNWTNNTTANTGFTCQRATNANFVPGLVSYTVTPGTATSYVNTTTLAANTTYYYRIRATIGAVTSAWSNTVTISTATPAAPTNLTAAMSGTSVMLNWVDNATNESGVIIQRATNSTFSTGLTTFNVAGVGVKFYLDGTTLMNTRYYYRVCATNGAGNSAWSNVVNILTPATPPTAPGAPTIGAAVAGNTRAYVSFTPPALNGGSAILSYTVTSSPGGFIGTGNTSPITVTGLTNGTPYTFTVTATNAVGTGPASGVSNSVTPGIVGPILDVTRFGRSGWNAGKREHDALQHHGRE